MGSLGDRIKSYEAATHYTATIRTPLMIRVDGRAFHTFTRGMERPFDHRFMTSMDVAAGGVAKEMQGFKAAYVQSDEVTFCITDYDRLETQGWFDYDLSKIISLTAAMMSVRFAEAFGAVPAPVFDCRAFPVPTHDVVNAFLWRAKDWERNSLQMYARAHFGHKQLHRKGRAEMHDMLHRIGKNWATDLTPQERNGTFITNEEDGLQWYFDVLPTYESVNSAIGHLFVVPS